MEFIIRRNVTRGGTLQRKCSIFLLFLVEEDQLFDWISLKKKKRKIRAYLTKIFNQITQKSNLRYKLFNLRSLPSFPPPFSPTRIYIKKTFQINSNSKTARSQIRDMKATIEATYFRSTSSFDSVPSMLEWIEFRSCTT